MVSAQRGSQLTGNQVIALSTVGKNGGSVTIVGVRIVPFEIRFADACAELIAALPNWFGRPDANAAYLRNLSELPSWVALIESELVGAITLEQHFPASFEIHFMAVRPEYHRRGVGHRLVEHVESEARARGGRWLQVKTMAPSYPDPFYAKTRAFYEAVGFSPLFESCSLWGPDTPVGVYVKTL